MKKGKILSLKTGTIVVVEDEELIPLNAFWSGFNRKYVIINFPKMSDSFMDDKDDG